MSILYRILVILVVATLIGGLFYAAVGSGDSTSRLPAPADGQPRPEGGEEREGESALPLGMVKSLVIMSIASGVYLGLGRLGRQKTLSA
ncbi:MAG: hypothetical protein HY864_01335 [Chloroflexi bacterium]|nr:hypothetical protein [Chloroflexota bacterium]